MKMKHLFLLAFMAFVGLTFTSCDEDEPETITGEALFSFTSDGKTVTFINESTFENATYLWDFGDSQTSADKNPVHVYEFKGEYVVTLTVTDKGAATHPISSKVKVDKASVVNLTDSSFDDWDNITDTKYVMSSGGENAGIVKAAKVDYDAKNVYVYLEFEGTVEYGYFMDFFFDNDNDTLTGNRGWLWPQMGADYLVEGQMSILDAHAGVLSFYFNGATQDAWSWADDKPFSTGYFTVGNFANIGANAAVELAFNREKVTGLSNDIVKIGVMLSDPTSWADVGYAPDKSSDDKPGSGFLIDMR